MSPTVVTPQAIDSEGKKSQPDHREGGFSVELLRFEELITHISSRLVSTTCSLVDREIEHALTEIRCFFNVDRCGLLMAWPDKQCFRITHASFTKNIPRIPLDIDLSRELFPWCYQKLFERQEVVSVETLDALPPEAVTDKKSCREWAIRSFLDIPIVLDGTGVYVIALNAVHQERTWPEEFIRRLSLLGGILVNALERRKKSRETEERLQFEMFLSDLSAKFVNLPADQVNAEVRNAQQRLCEFLGLDRSTLWQPFVDDQGVMRLTHIHQPEEAPPVTTILDAGDLFPWTTERVMNGEVVTLRSMADLPPEAVPDLESFRFYLSKSALVLPLRAAGTVIGMVSFATIRDERDWPDELIRRLQILAEVFANAIARKNADLALHESEARLDLAASSAGAGLWILEPNTGHIWATDRARELFGYPKEDAISFYTFLEIVHPDDREYVNQAIEQSIKNKENLKIEYRIVLPDESVRWIIARGRPYFSASGEPERLMGVSLDLTEHKQMEGQLKAQIRETEELRKKVELENIYLRQEKNLLFDYEHIIGKSNALKRVLSQVEQVAPTDSTVLLTGETGTGKELIAEAIHSLSKRKSRVLVKVDCACLPAALVESELFGREKGAYTGAMCKQVGRFEIADGSTIFLDEIGELPLELQAKLLRVLQKGEFERLGSPHTIQVNVRVIAATNRNLEEALQEGTFREDLYYRLGVFPIEVPPLRNRVDDIPFLVRAFVREFSDKMNKNIESVPRTTMEALQRYPWPGNIRELRNVIEQAVIISNGDTLHVNLPSGGGPATSHMCTLVETERQHIVEMLGMTGWRIKGPRGAAKLLGMKPSTLYAKMKRLGIPTRTEKDVILT